MTTIEKLTWLFTHCHHVSVESNPQRISYQPATEYVHESCDLDDDDEIIGKIDDTRTLYRVQVYPDTPVGFNVAVGHDLDAVLDAVLPDGAATITSLTWAPVRTWEDYASDDGYNHVRAVWHIKGPAPFGGLRCQDEDHAIAICEQLHARPRSE